MRTTTPHNPPSISAASSHTHMHLLVAARALARYIEERKKRITDALKDELETRIRCIVCMERMKEMTFQCGHRTCVTCAARVDQCPQCRALITLRIRSYD